MADIAVGTKYDGGKTRHDLMPPEALTAIAQILTDGAAKYDARNWEKGMGYGRLYAATQRHLLAFWGGEDKDPESGHEHLAHAATDIIFLLTYQMRGIGEDDRPLSASIKPPATKPKTPLSRLWAWLRLK